MRIKCLEQFRDGTDLYHEGDVRTVAKLTGEYFCSLGWAEDVDGKVATGERQKDGESRLDPRGAKHEVTTDG